MALNNCSDTKSSLAQAARTFGPATNKSEIRSASDYNVVAGTEKRISTPQLLRDDSNLRKQTQKSLRD